MMDELKVIYHKGRYRSTWFYVKAGGGNPVLDFIMTHHQTRPNEIKRLRAVMQRICEYQRPNTEMFRHEGNGIYAIKAHQPHIYGFFDGRCFIMCHAVFKKQNKARREDLNKTAQIRKEYFQRKVN